MSKALRTVVGVICASWVLTTTVYAQSADAGAAPTPVAAAPESVSTPVTNKVITETVTTPTAPASPVTAPTAATTTTAPMPISAPVAASAPTAPVTSPPAGAGVKQTIGERLAPPPEVSSESLFAAPMTEQPQAQPVTPRFMSLVGAVTGGAQWMKKDVLDDGYKPEGVRIASKRMMDWTLHGFGYLSESFRTGIRANAVIGSVEDLSKGPRTGYLVTASGAAFFDAMVPIESWRIGAGLLSGGGLVFAGTSPEGKVFDSATSTDTEGPTTPRRKRMIPMTLFGPRLIVSLSVLPMMGIELISEYNAMYLLRNEGAPDSPVHVWSITLGPSFGRQPNPLITEEDLEE